MATIQIDRSFNNLIVTSVSPTSSDRAYMDANPECVYIMYRTQVQDVNLSFAWTDIRNFYIGNEG